MACTCIATVDAELASKNARLITAMDVERGGVRLFLPTAKIVPRGKKPPIVLATYCPFCGTRVSTEADA